MMMRSPVVLVACILLVSSFTVLASHSEFGPNLCCFKFVSKPLPPTKVAAYRLTDNMCSKKGVLFVMEKGLEFCADPHQQWAKKLMETKPKK